MKPVKSVNTISSVDQSVSLVAQIFGDVFGNLKSTVKERSVPNAAAISVLKQSIERGQMRIESAQNTVDASMLVYQAAKAALREATKHKNEDVQTLATIAKVSGVGIDWHELNETCDSDDCNKCGDSIE